MGNNTNTNTSEKKPVLIQYIVAIIILPFYLLFSKKTRKAAWAVVLVAAAIWGGIVIFGGGSGNSVLKKGDKAMAAGKYDAAVKNYLKAGENVDDEWVEAAEAYIGEIDNGNGTEAELVKILLRADESYKATESYGAGAAEVAAMLMERAENAAYPGTETERKDAVEERYTVIDQLLDSAECGELEALDEARKNLALSWTITLLDQTSVSYAGWMWDEQADNPYCTQLEEAYALLVTNEKAAENKFRSILEGTQYIDRLDTFCCMLINPSVPGSIDSELVKAKASAQISDFRMSDYYENGRWPEKVEINKMETGIDKDGLSKQLSNQERAELAQRIGQEANGKVLVLHKRTDYGAAEPVLDIDLGFMRELPSQLLPERLEEVEYVILVISDYEEDGTYDNSDIAAVKEHAKIILYDAVGKAELIHTPVVSGRYAESVLYSGEAPEWHSAGAPDMDDEAREILQKIESLLKK